MVQARGPPESRGRSKPGCPGRWKLAFITLAVGRVFGQSFTAELAARCLEGHREIALDAGYRLVFVQVAYDIGSRSYSRLE